MIINEIIKQKRSVYILRFEHKSISVTENMLAEYFLYKGADVDEEKIAFLEIEFDKMLCYDKALNLLHRRDHFKKELKEKLLQRSFSNTAITYTLKKLEVENLIDPMQTATYIVDNKIQKESISKIKYYLNQRGCPKHIIQKVLSEYESNECSKAYVKIIAKAKHLSNLKTQANKNKLIRYLINQGFCYQDAKKAYDALLQREESL